MPTVERSAPVEIRLSGRTLHGIALRYGEQARDRPERFTAGAFAPIGPVSMNLQHDPERVIATTAAGTLTVTDHPDRLETVAELRAGSAELSLVQRGGLRGLSVEFRAVADRRDTSGVRVIDRAELVGIGLVDAGSYRSDIELRRRRRERFSGAWLTASVPFATTMQCECQGPTCTEVRFEPSAFDDLAERDDVLAVGGGGFANVLGSTRRGSLIVETGRRGLRIGLTEANTETARRIVEAAAVADIYVRPLIDIDASEYRDEGTVRTFTMAVTRALLVKPTPNARGHQPARIRGVTAHRRRRLWL